MRNKENDVDELTNLLRKSIEIYEKDRKLAIQNYEDLEKQLEVILDNGFEMSEEAKLEKEKNNALKLVIESGKRLDNAITTISKIIITQLNGESRERAAGLLSGEQGYVNDAVNVHDLLTDETDREDRE